MSLDDSGRVPASERIQPLRCAAEEEEGRCLWFKVVDVPADQSAGRAVVLLDSLSNIPPQRRVPMRVTQLLRPFARVFGAFASEEALVRFSLVAAEELQSTEIPIRAVLRHTGKIERPASLLQLAGEIPGEGWGPRVRLDQVPAASWAEHVRKHFCDERSLSALEPAIARSVVKFRPHQLRVAARRVAHGAPGYGPSGLGVRLWPLLEAYAALSVDLLEQLTQGPAIHVERQGIPSTAASQLWRELCARADDGVPFGEEALFALPSIGALLVARGRAGASLPLRWRTTFPCEDGERALLRRFRLLKDRPGFRVFEWDPDRLAASRARQTRKATSSRD